MSHHILRLEDDKKLCELPPGSDMLEVGFVKVDSLREPGLPCVACSIVIAEANRALDDDWKKRHRR